ncbi:uncharacterized protein LOC129580912 [Paramacrobiotus metropolitanus]|uniref:uncharacterized protein LOC129580912 n=1 Tax=Paramacrobiotus metropolitanus TaxID=2943436 RepID=UPI0024463275|nr:uncharacterized protein LOC129580912 [Paramacrobiotus metropolitanus]
MCCTAIATSISWRSVPLITLCILFSLSHNLRVTAEIVDNDAQKITANISQALPNVTLILHPPVMVPAISLPDRQEIQAAAEDANKIHGNKLTEIVKNDTLTVTHAVLQAVEHLTNVSQENPAMAPPVIPVAPQRSQNASGSSVSVVVVPLVQNAFDLVDHNTSTLAQAAAENPLVISSKNGSHTTLHVVVKRESADANVHNITSATDNSHGPLNTDVDLSASAVQSLPRSPVLIIEKNATGPLLAKPAELVTQKVVPETNASTNVDAVPFAKVTTNATEGNTTGPGAPLLLPSLLVPAPGPVIHLAPQLGFLPLINASDVPAHVADQPQTAAVDHEATTQEMLSNNFTVGLPTLSPVQIAKVAQPSQVNPLPVGTFAFIPDKNQNNVSRTDLLLHLQ